MSRSIATKFVAFVLAACSLVAAVASVLGISLLAAEGMYTVSPEDQAQDQMRDYSYTVAIECAERYAARQLGQCPEHLVESIFGGYPGGSRYEWSARILRHDELLEQIGSQPGTSRQFSHSFVVTYPSAVRGEQEPVRTAAVTIWEKGEQVEHNLYYYNSPEYTVEVSVEPRFMEENSWAALEWLYSMRYQMIFWAALSLLVFAGCLVYLCCVAGKAPGSAEVRPAGLNRLPLDLYAAVVGLLGAGGCGLGLVLAEWTFSDDINYGAFSLGLLLAVVLSLLVVAYLFAVAAQLKTKGGYWWRNSLLGRMLRSLGRVAILLPVIWRWLLTGAVMALGMGGALVMSARTADRLWDAVSLAMLLVCAGIVCYGGYAFGTLLRGVHKMNRGDLEYKIPTGYLVGSFRKLAEDLNALADSAVVAAQKQLRSERMKTELITNVSHDIKTPLTSIINYVDLLQKSKSETEREQYLQVLSRQSLRLKKLIDDLMEMSKASTGNLTVDITDIDVAEAVNQALGEFSGKFEKTRLIPVFAAPVEPIIMKADGRLVWRVLSNLLGNAVKYAMPGTRVYIDTARVDGQVLISIKNISAEPLNVSSEELMERFVRGDASRNTEGSGLGLNIAKSLMEVQKGQLNLLVDGDLFKVTLLFPEA